MEKGSAWIDGNNLYIVGEDGYIWYYTGEVVGNASNAKPGSVWIDETSGDCMYIDSSKNIRKILSNELSTLPGVAGSVWIESHFLSWIDKNSKKRVAHTNVAHSNYTQTSSHSNSSGRHYNSYTSHSNSYGFHINNQPTHHNTNPTHSNYYIYHNNGNGSYGQPYHLDQKYHSNTVTGSHSNYVSNHANYYTGHSNVPSSHSNYSTSHSNYYVPGVHSNIAYKDSPKRA
jgi:hypothetical protein